MTKILPALERDHSISFLIDHLFSAEIEPFKQAYIERNFQPPILFRDVRQLKNEKASVSLLYYILLKD